MRRSSPAAMFAAAIFALCGVPAAAAIQQTPSSRPVADSRARFREIFCAVEADHGSKYPYDRPCAQALHLLPGEAARTGDPVYLGPAREKLRIVVVPGIVGECVEKIATPFEDAIGPMRERGWEVQVLRVGGRAGSAANALAIRDQLRSLKLAPDERLVLIGYSKGMSDILELLGGPDQVVIPSGSAIVSLTGVVRGTPIADSANRAYRLFRSLPLPGCPAEEGNGVESLTRAYRLRWLETHRLPARLHYYSLPAYTSESNVSVLLKGSWRTLARIDPRNDGNVIFSDAIIPGSWLLGYANSDHWALILPFALKAPLRARLFATHNDYPRVVLLESIARYFDELYLAESRAGGAAR